jgi:RNA polymerase sigma-70 factor (ECF subfamily)
MDAEESCHANVPELPKACGEAVAGACSADGLLVERLRCGDVDAGYHFFREYYPRVYRYLFWLTERSEQAEDLAQETFARAWRHLEGFDPRGSLRAWLHRIAHREFLRSVRRESPAQLSVVGEVAAPEATPFTEAVALREILRRLPAGEREVVLLHDLEGYSSSEIALIVGAPASTVRRRLAHGRERLRQELGEDDLTYLNEPLAPMRQWAWLPLEQMRALEARLALGGGTKEDAMERREFLRQAAAGAAGLMLPEKEVVDSRLTKKVTLAVKAMALCDLCEKLVTDSGIQMVAGNSVADEKVTVFCEKLPLREVMRQLSRPFGYTWLRSGTPGQYRYELVQDLRSQLLEEELRNRDRNAALISLEREIERYRPYLRLSPDEALARAKTAPPEGKKLLESLAGDGWGPIQVYFRLSPQQLEALRSGETLIFSEAPRPGEPSRPGYLTGSTLPPDLARGTLQSLRGGRLVKQEDGSFSSPTDPNDPKALPLTAIPEARAYLYLTLSQNEMGQFALSGSSGAFILRAFANRLTWSIQQGSGPYAVGMPPVAVKTDSSVINVKLASDPVMRRRVTIQPQASCRPAPDAASGDSAAPEAEPKVTSADVLEALHRATGFPIVADFYTRLYRLGAVSVRNQPLLEVLNQLGDTMRLRWNKEGEWLQSRSASYYHDRLKEVPNRLLSRWAMARRQHMRLTLEEVVEIAQLSDAQLDANDMAEGAQECWGLMEWRLPRDGRLRSHLRFLAGFTPEQRQETMSAAGLPFARMPLPQQQKFIQFALEYADEPLQSLEELEGALLRVDYTHPGWFQWKRSNEVDASRWVVALEAGPHGRRVILPPVRERTWEAALQAARRIFPPVTEGMLQAARRYNPQIDATQLLPQESQIYPTQLNLVLVYISGITNARPVRMIGSGFNLGGGAY